MVAAGSTVVRLDMAQPDFLLCLECETPTYVFEWQDGRTTEATCPMCGNDDPTLFVTEEELEDMAEQAAEEDEES
jgi:uncharacterized Zn finger protein (UPF0148 family)